MKNIKGILPISLGDAHYTVCSLCDLCGSARDIF